MGRPPPGRSASRLPPDAERSAGVPAGDDLLSALIHLEEEGDRLDHVELLSMVQWLPIAGHETTVNLIGNGMYELMRHPDEQQRLVAHPDLLETAVEEMLRFNGPVETPFPASCTRTSNSTRLPCPRGTWSCRCCWPPIGTQQCSRSATASRSRATPTGTSRGFGIRHCLGAPLARLEGRNAIRTLVERYPAIRFATDPATLAWNPGFFLRGLRPLPVSLG